MTVERSPNLSRVVEVALKKGLSQMSVCVPAKVQAFYGGPQPSVDVIPCIGNTVVEEDRETTETPPMVASVPLLFPGSGVYRLTFPVSAGDYVLLVVADRSIDEFIASGGVQIPAALHSHDLMDCFAIPGVTAPPISLSPIDTTHVVLGKIGDTPKQAARKGDGVGNGTLVFGFTPGSGGAALSLTYNPGNGGASQSLIAGNGTITLGELITSGSSDVSIT